VRIRHSSIIRHLNKALGNRAGPRDTAALAIQQVDVSDLRTRRRITARPRLCGEPLVPKEAGAPNRTLIPSWTAVYRVPTVML